MIIIEPIIFVKVIDSLNSIEDKNIENKMLVPLNIYAVDRAVCLMICCQSKA